MARSKSEMVKWIHERMAAAQNNNVTFTGEVDRIQESWIVRCRCNHCGRFFWTRTHGLARLSSCGCQRVDSCYYDPHNSRDLEEIWPLVVAAGKVA